MNICEYCSEGDVLPETHAAPNDQSILIDALKRAGKDYKALSEVFYNNGWLSAYREAKETAEYIDAVLAKY